MVTQFEDRLEFRSFVSKFCSLWCPASSVKAKRAYCLSSLVKRSRWQLSGKQQEAPTDPLQREKDQLRSLSGLLSAEKDNGAVGGFHPVLPYLRPWASPKCPWGGDSNTQNKAKVSSNPCGLWQSLCLWKVGGLGNCLTACILLHRRKLWFLLPETDPSAWSPRPVSVPRSRSCLLLRLPSSPQINVPRPH